MPTYLLILFGQIVSMVGTQLTGFGLGVWVFERTQSVTLYGVVSAAVLIPRVLVSPLVGVWIDRWDRRKLLIAEHLGAGITSLTMVLLFSIDQLEVWTIIAANSLASLCYSIGYPTFSAVTASLVPASQLGRANGLFELGWAGAMIVSPALAGFLLSHYGLGAILLADVVTFLFALCVLALVRFPTVQVSSQSARTTGSYLGELGAAWRYIRQQRGLLVLLALATAANFNTGLVMVLLAPLVLGFADAQSLGNVMAFGGIGMLLGGGAMAWWGGPRRPVKYILIFMLLNGMVLFLGAARPSLPLVGIAAFAFLFTVPLFTSLSQTLWQKLVATELQGRVFSFREAATTSVLPIAYLIAGPLVDHIFDPLMAANGPLASSLGAILGVGAGRGVALTFCIAGTSMLLSVGLAAFSKSLRALNARSSGRDSLSASPQSPQPTPPSLDTPIPYSTVHR